MASIWAAVLGRRARRHRRQLLRAGRRLDPQHPGGRQGRQAGLHVTPRDLFKRPRSPSSATSPWLGARAADDKSPARGPVPLTPIQRWFFEQDLADAAPLEPGVPVRGPGRTSTSNILEEASARWSRTTTRSDCDSGKDDRWQQDYAPSRRSAPIERMDLSAVPPDGARSAPSTARARALQARLDMAERAARSSRSLRLRR